MREKHLAKQILVALAAENTISKAPAETIKASQLSEKWDKVFPENRQVTHHKVTFHNRYGLTLVGDLYMPLLSYSNEIETPVLMLHGEKAHSRYYSEDAFRKLTGSNKELYIIPGAVHTDLYDRMDIIPFDKIEAFFRVNLRYSGEHRYDKKQPYLDEAAFSLWEDGRGKIAVP